MSNVNLILETAGIVSPRDDFGDVPVDTGGVGLPNIDECTQNWPASVDIDVLDLQEGVHALRVEIFLHVLAHHLTPNIVGTVGDGRSQDAAGVGSEDG
jgi:hypothetical protein